MSYISEHGFKGIVAIHQPSFLPWLGFFDKILRSEIFVILDDVQFPKKGGYWANRVKIIVSGKPAWITMPVVRAYHGLRNINQMKINDTLNWRDKIKKTVELNYAKAPYFSEVMPVIEAIFSFNNDTLIEFNLNAIKILCSALNINTDNFVLSSTLDKHGAGTDMLISIVRATGMHSYMCGGGASKYQEDEKFAQAGINLIYQNFRHPEYKQFNTSEFSKGLSVIDLLMNEGIEKSRETVRYNLDS